MSILWKTTRRFEDSLLEECKDYMRTFPRKKGEFSTTYYTSEGLTGTSMEKPLLDFYDELIADCTKDLGLYHISGYGVVMWMQMYDHTTTGHTIHSHFAGQECLSWVHFLDTPNQKCFFFIDSYGKKHYPEHQKSGDVIAFPSWALHGVDRVEEPGDRTVIAGNVYLNRYNYDGLDLGSITFENTVLWVKKINGD